MTNKKAINKSLGFDEAQYPEIPKELKDKLYEMGKPIGYKQHEVVQSIDDFTKNHLIELKNKSKDSEGFYKELKEEGYIKNPLEEFDI